MFGGFIFVILKILEEIIFIILSRYSLCVGFNVKVCFIIEFLCLVFIYGSKIYWYLFMNVLFYFRRGNGNLENVFVVCEYV